jgi:DDE superfamily endonuclease
LAAELAHRVANLMPNRNICLVADSAYINASVLENRPSNLQIIGPLSKKAALYLPAPTAMPGQRGRPRRRGERLPTPAQVLEDTERFPALEQGINFPKAKKVLRVQVVRDVLWYKGSKTDRVAVVLTRDPEGHWRDEVLLSTDPTATVEEVLIGYCRRWSIELSFFDSKQYLGLHEPRVWTEASVERAHPMAWFCYSLSVLWYALHGEEAEAVKRDRPWYNPKATPAFTDMLGALRLALWRQGIFSEAGATTQQPPSKEMLERLLHCLAAVR